MDWRKDNNFPTSIKIARIVQETPRVRTFVFQYKLGAKPGQFVNMWLPCVSEKPFSVAFDGGDFFEIAVANVGEFTDALFQKKVGDFVGIRGPYGIHFTFQPRQKLILVGGGYGAAPLYFLARQAVKQKCHVTYISGARSKEHLLYLQRFQKLLGVTVKLATDDDSLGHKGYATEVLERLLMDKKKSRQSRVFDCIYTCGPELMMKKVSDIAFAHKIPAQITVERYMKCGLGVCGNCCVDDSGVTTCIKGTVMDNETVRSIKEFGVYHRDCVGKKTFFH